MEEEHEEREQVERGAEEQRQKELTDQDAVTDGNFVESPRD